jgi:hydrophobic/amphiphilic exporter-1 (mainly G- bacteria), HAE1 family
LFDKVLKFFIENYRMNYILFILIFIFGVYSYNKIPKEIFPQIEPNVISIKGSYSGTSVDVLNKIAVQEIENGVKNIDGVKSITSTISTSNFRIYLELDDNSNKNDIKDKIKDTISTIKSNLPSNMKEPSVNSVIQSRSILHLAIFSSKLKNNDLKEVAKSIKDKILSIKDISDVTIYGDSKEFYELIINERKIEAYGISLDKTLNILSQLSYIYPLGKIDDKNSQYYLSTTNSRSSIKEFENTIININNKKILIKDIATIKKTYEKSSTLASLNSNNAIILAVSQDPRGDAITISSQITTLLSKIDIPNVEFKIRRDQSKLIKNRLNTVISNIMLAIILITLLTYILINIRMAFIIAIGIPTAFMLGAIYFYISGQSINISSLIGVLIAIGIIVDDAIIISENIQQYIEKGYSNTKAALVGTKEMAKPLIIATLTTLFAFLPLLMLSGKIGQIIQLIPIAFSALVFASIVESFIFLPIHSTHILNKNSRPLSWEKIKNIYMNVLKYLTYYQKTFLTIFILIVPLLIYAGVKNSKFQIFQSFDASSISITFKASSNTTLKESLNIIQQIEKEILTKKNDFFTKDITSVAGYTRTATGSSEVLPYVGYITLELYNKQPSNFVDKYINPYLSPYPTPIQQIRTKSSQEISKDIRAWLKKSNLKTKYNLNTLLVLERRIGNTKTDIRIGVVSSDYKKAIKTAKKIKTKLQSTKGIKFSGHNIQLGTKELKLELNSYGKKLGITQQYLGQFLSNFYLNKKIGVIIGDKELLDIKIKSINKDSLKELKNLKIPLLNGNLVTIKEITIFKETKTLEKLLKDDGKTNFFVFANIDEKISTSNEILNELKPFFNSLKKDDIQLVFKGEQEQNKTIKNDMILASSIALLLIFLAILYLFNSIKETFILLSIIPFSFLGIFIGHNILDLNISLPSLIGALGLAGVIVNDGIIMMMTIKKAKNKEDIFTLAARRFRPIILTSITTIVGLSSLIFFASGQSVTFQPIGVSIGFGLLWGTILNLIYLPIMYNFLHKYRNKKIQ